jgi:hypothetical protein
VSLHISSGYKSNKPTFIDQTRYFLELLKKINMKDTKPISTPMASSLSGTDTVWGQWGQPTPLANFIFS